ncbi:BadF/BadG/BcrA/BcrD ATPase family protein [Pelagicoccus mobilis]|uniref:ATPase BadF/BadG/BcrA/BcrD type domain-containing protein n=1 Tax=Pelagicoccus mobilis TaxID=415221 RepID=A0A934S0C4_9BACT|nr:BadF/BadG/BcrA/BcrD ATPase family protein [Pelagicoccus mobilis]MBK1876768.1 hypothetical protein [Pelagicoccus mobilis]
MNPTTSANLYIGVDGGGTRTRATAMDENGNVLGSGVSSGSNPNNIGFSKAANSILDAIEGTQVSFNENTTLCLGIAGVASEEDREALRYELISAIPALESARLILTHDLAIAHHAAFQGAPGMILIGGTGSACYARDANGKSFRASGRNFHYDDPGSGYAIGRRAIDNKLLLSTDARESIAALAPRVIELASEGDLKALDILRIEAEHIAKLARLVFLEFSKSEPNPKLALSGGILKADTLYRASVIFELQRALPGIEIIDPQTTPERAAVELAKG